MFKREIKDIIQFSHWINTMTSKGLECRHYNRYFLKTNALSTTMSKRSFMFGERVGGVQGAWGQCLPWTPWTPPTRLSGWSWTLRAGPYQAYPALPRSRKLSSGSRQHWALSESGRWGYKGTLQRRPPSASQGCHPFSGRRCCSSHPANHSSLSIGLDDHWSKKI